MGHITSKNYKDLQLRLDSFAQGAPESDALYQILEILFTEHEAGLVSKLPIKFITVKTAAKRWKKTEKEAEIILDSLAHKGLLLDIENKKKRHFILPPTMAGFFEFSIMRTDGRYNRKLLSELFYQYINIEEDFVAMLFNLKVPIARTFVHENEIEEKDKSEILDYEKASRVIATATCITVGTCYCRHKMEHMGKACDMPQDVCLTFNNAAKSLAKHGVAKKINKQEAKKILDKCVSLGLVQVGDNVKNRVGWICNCCGCCCEALIGYKRLGNINEFDTNFFAVNDEKKCTGCGMCVKKCAVDAIEIKEINNKKQAHIDLNKCIGCGVCAQFCTPKSMHLKRKEEINFTPQDSFERCVLNAIETGKLQNYIFDNFNSWTHASLRKLLGIIFSLDAVKKIAVSKQLRSKFLFALTKARNNALFNKLYGDGEKIVKK